FIFFIKFSSFIAFGRLPLISSFLVMNAVVGESCPLNILTKFAAEHSNLTSAPPGMSPSPTAPDPFLRSRKA
ncbi:hypothetical protein PFISCL1PPCAC_5900, partial [Pristionchus fissidentatus]